MKSHWVLVAFALVAFAILFGNKGNAPSAAVGVDDARQKYLVALQISELEYDKLGRDRAFSKEHDEANRGKSSPSILEDAEGYHQILNAQYDRADRALKDVIAAEKVLNEARGIKVK